MKTWPPLQVAILMVAAGLLFFRLSVPAEYVHDECYQAFTAHRYVVGDRHAWDWRWLGKESKVRTDDVTKWTWYEVVHPPVAKLVMAASISILGFTPFAWRLGSVLFGLMTLLVTMRLATRLGDWKLGALAGALLLCDGLWLVMSRIAMNDIYATAFTTAGLATFYRAWTAEPQHRTRLLVACGVLLGAGLATRWSAAAALVECGLLAFAGELWLWRQEPGSRPWVRIGWCALAFVVLPLAIYLVSYGLYFAQGYSLTDLVALHRWIVRFHRYGVSEHLSASPWWTWPLDARPVWLYQHKNGDLRSELYAMGNPLLWWSLLPAMLYVSLRFVRRREASYGIVVLGFFGQWLPWAFVGRTAFIQYFLPSLPFGVIAVAMAVRNAAAHVPRARAWLCGGYVAACALVLLWFYPVWTAWPVSVASLDSKRWFWFELWRY
jgi:dolichyl-phosphate-mannose--protein O-mannosyl transferase